MTAREVDFTTKPESSNGEVGGKINSSTSSSTSSWSRLKDPRIVRVSRAFGGKDRHSKVCTVRGLRDRRVRLSVPTAIQLYDLQDRLGLNQPSKVVDWLLNAAKHEIDELPPLQIPPGSFTFSQNLHPGMNSNDFRLPSDHQDKEALNLKQSRMDLWRSDKPSKDVGAQETTTLSRNENDGMNLLNNVNAMPPYNSFLRWDPSNLSLSNSRSSGLTTQQTEDFHNFNLVPLPSSAVSHVPIIPSGSSHQVLVYHQPRMTQSYFPSPDEFDPKQVLNFQMLNPNSQLSSNSLTSSEPVRPFHFSMTNNGERETNKHEEFHDPV